MDKLSSRITKMQSDNQMRFNDLESTGIASVKKPERKIKKDYPEQIYHKILEGYQIVI